MIPVAEDNQLAAAEPQHAELGHLIGFSMTLGIFQSLASLVFYLCMDMGLVKGIEDHRDAGYPTGIHAQNAIWLQVSIAAEFLIFSARAPGLFFFSMPSHELLISTMLGNIISTILAIYAFEDPLDWDEAITIWIYDILALFFVDITKMAYKYINSADAAGIIDEAEIAREDQQLGQKPHNEGEPVPVQEHAGHIRKQRESVKLIGQMKSRGASTKSRGASMKFLTSGQQRETSIRSRSVVMGNKTNTRAAASKTFGDLRKRTPGSVIVRK